MEDLVDQRKSIFSKEFSSENSLQRNPFGEISLEKENKKQEQFKLCGKERLHMKVQLEVIKMKNELIEFYKGKKVFVTGHTGFKGSWLCSLLLSLGADVSGYALLPPTSPNLFTILELDRKMRSHIADIRNQAELERVLQMEEPEIIFHLAAQPIVRTSYNEPVLTYETNVMGTVYLMDAIRQTESVHSVINVTTDKVYENMEWDRGYTEEDILNGFDPYSNSKSCSELVTASYRNSFFNEKKLPVTTCRAGNVIGGGDFAPDRIIPDCFRAVLNHKEIILRNPGSIRPYQHVMEPIMAYVMIAMEQYRDHKKAGSYNIGPRDKDCVRTDELTGLFVRFWEEDARWKSIPDGGPHEAGFLKLDSGKIKAVFGIEPRWNIEKAVEKTVEWFREMNRDVDMWNVTQKQILEFMDTQ